VSEKAFAKIAFLCCSKAKWQPSLTWPILGTSVPPHWLPLGARRRLDLVQERRYVLFPEREVRRMERPQCLSLR
jgi:hypothetical protein